VATTFGPFTLLRPLPAWGSGFHFALHSGDVDDDLPARAIVRIPLAGEGPLLADEGGRRARSQRPPCPFVPRLVRTILAASGPLLVFEPAVAVRLEVLLDAPLPATFALAYVDDVAAAVLALSRARGDDDGALQLSFDELLVSAAGRALVLTPPVGPRASMPGLLQQPRRDRPLFAPEKLRAERSGREESWMLGALLFSLLTNAEPDDADASVRALQPDLPEALDALVRRALAPDPRARFESVEELRAALARCNDEFAPDDNAAIARGRAGWRFDEAEGLLR
jgi:hypothetical protein